MLNKLRKFKESKFAIVLVAMIAIPFVFWGMGGTFSSGNTNSIAKINDHNISTQDFNEHLNSSNLKEKYIRDNIEKGILEELLSELIMNKLIEIELENLGVFISHKSLADKIKKNKIFFDENNNFSRIKYEKFLLENNTSAALYEMGLKNNELKKKLFNYIGGGLISPYFISNQNYISENKKVKIMYLDLNHAYNNNFSVTEIDDYIKKNESLLKRELYDIYFIKLTPMILTQTDDFSNEFYKIIDDIENSILNDETINDIKNRYNLELDQVKNYYKKKGEVNETLNQIENSKNANKLNIIDNNDHFLLYETSNFRKILPSVDDVDFLNQVKEKMFFDEKVSLHKKLIEKIQDKSINENIFKKLANKKDDLIITKELNSINDHSLFKKYSVDTVYSLPKNQFLLISDKKDNIYLAKIIEIKFNTLNKNSSKISEYTKLSNSNIKKKLYTTYDLFLNKKYKIDINQNTLERLKNYFK